MELDKFIKMQLDMLDQQFSEAQVRNEVYRYVFKNSIPNLTIDAMIDRCMELYAEIIKRYNA